MLSGMVSLPPRVLSGHVVSYIARHHYPGLLKDIIVQNLKKERKKGSSGNRTRELSLPERDK